MYYSDEVIDEVRLGNDIVDVVSDYVKLTRKGANYFGLCPFHNEKTPSFSVNREKQIFRCFGCGAGGNVFSFVSQKENFTFVETLEYLAKRINYKLPEKAPSKADAYKREIKEQLWEMHKAAARFYYDCLNSEQGKNAMDYLNNRGLVKGVRNKFGIGYAPITRGALNEHLLSLGYDQEMVLKSGLVTGKNDGKYYDKFFNRVMFPIIDVYGHIIGFGGRVLGQGEPKYLNSPETEIFNKSYNLYNLNLAKLANKKELILVEGYMDVIALYQAGFKNAVASLGTAFNDNHARVMKRYTKNVILLFDSDNAGVNAVLRAIPVLMNAGIKVKVLQVTDAKDPDEYIKKFGADAFGELLGRAVNQVIFRINILKKQYSLENTDEKITFINEVVKILSEIDNKVELEIYIDEVAKSTGISASALRQEIEKIQGISVSDSDTPRISRKVKSVTTNNKQEDAKRTLINLLASDRALFYKVKTVFDKKEFADELYIRLYDIIEQLHSEDKPVLEADILSRIRLDEKEEQSQIALVFIGQLPYETAEQQRLALVDSLTAIKKNYIDNLIETTQDDEKVMELLEQSRNINNVIKGLYA